MLCATFLCEDLYHAKQVIIENSLHIYPTSSLFMSETRGTDVCYLETKLNNNNNTSGGGERERSDVGWKGEGEYRMEEIWAGRMEDAGCNHTDACCREELLT